ARIRSRVSEAFAVCAVGGAVMRWFLLDYLPSNALSQCKPRLSAPWESCAVFAPSISLSRPPLATTLCCPDMTRWRKPALSVESHSAGPAMRPSSRPSRSSSSVVGTPTVLNSRMLLPEGSRWIARLRTPTSAKKLRGACCASANGGPARISHAAAIPVLKRRAMARLLRSFPLQLADQGQDRTFDVLGRERPDVLVSYASVPADDEGLRNAVDAPV